SPEAFCNTSDTVLLSTVLNSYDQETADFYRWRVEYTQEELSDLLRHRSGIDFGSVLELRPLRRGASGRIIELLIRGTLRTVSVGKELEIRRWLSESHLYSSAFVVDTEGPAEMPERFVLHGAGWGHGVGLCQIGAAAMSAEGCTFERILSHYFRGSVLTKLY
ncbi:MAG TPA: amidase, partial [Candidatus Coprenecus pullistercoris]|nr:amidase [Candidatus Coprenecus pullistercoris]